MRANNSLRGLVLKCLITAILVVVLAVASQPAQGQQKLTTLKIGILPIISILPLFAAVDKGYLEQERIKAELIPTAGGAVGIPAIVGGSIQMAMANVISILLAREQGIDILIISDGVNIDKRPPAVDALLTLKGSGIRTVRDLAGKKVATNTLKSIGWLYMREAVKRAGGDRDSIIFMELPFPKMGPALLKGVVDAIHAVEPFITIMRKNPKVVLVAWHHVDLNPGGVLAPYVASREWIKKHPDLVKRYARAYYKGVDFVNANPDGARQLLPKYTRITPPLAKEVSLGHFRKHFDIENFQWTSDLMQAHGLLKRKHNVAEYVYETAR